MRTHAELLARLTNPGIIAVVRAKQSEALRPLAEALIAGGVLAIEITLTTPNALRAIRELSRDLGAHATIGVGSVLNAASANAALEAGAEFVVSPITKPEIAAAARAAQRPVMLGAYTPTEAQFAHEAGADFIKIFPADKLGPEYCRALRAPMPHLRLVPTGGVDLTTAAAFMQAGCAALGVGSSLVSARLLETANWPELTRLAQAYVAIVRPAGSQPGAATAQ